MATTVEGFAAFAAVAANDSDPNGDNLVIDLVGMAMNGETVNIESGIRYIPNPGFTGTDSFTYRVVDGNGGSDEGLVTVTVNEIPENVQPFAPSDPAPDGSFGIGVSSVPDVNGDGLDDFAIGEADENGIETRGRAYLYDGATGDLLRMLTSPEPQSGTGFGISVAGVSDVNGDGAGDLLIGAYLEDVGDTSSAGRAYLFSGATGALLRTLESPDLEAVGLGWQVAAVPDTDGDNLEDLLIGNSGGQDVYLFSGATGLLLQTLVSPEVEGALFGFAVTGLSDVDGDGRGDVAVGDFSAGSMNEGRAYTFSGATGELLQTFLSSNPENGGFFGFPVSRIEDISGDGLDDVLVGAFNEDGGAENAGRAHVFDSATGMLIRTLTSPNPEQSGGFGIGTSGIPDVDGDGVDDHLIGAWSEDVVENGGGRAYVFSGATGALLETLESPAAQAGGVFGRTVAGVPDLDGDGRGEALIGARGEDSGALNAGRAYLFRSGQDGGPGGGFDVEPGEVTVALNREEQTTVDLVLTNNASMIATWSFPQCITRGGAFGPRGAEPAHRGVQPHVDLGKGQKDPRPGHAPRFGAGGPDGFGYRWIDSNEPGGPVFDFVDISETGILLSTISNTDDISELVALPFTFSFYGQDFNDVHVSTNGYISFGQGFGDFTNDPIPSEVTPNGFAAPFWDDLDPRTTEAAIYAQDLGDGRFVVQYDMIRDFPASSTPGTEKTFQVILSESGSILYQYADMGEGLIDATVGTENFDGTDGLEIAFNEAYVESGLAVLITRQPAWITAVEPPCGTLEPSQSVTVGVTLDATDLVAGTYTQDLVLTTDVTGSEQIPIPITLTVTEASIVVEAPEEAATGSGFPVSAIVEGFTPTTAELRYRPSGATDFLSEPLALVDGAYEGSIPAEFQTLRGIEYYLFLSDGERTATFPALDPELNPARVRVRVEQQAAAIELPPDAAYRMVSVPAVLDVPDPLAVFGDDYGEYGETSWRLFRWEPGLDEYAELVPPDTLDRPVIETPVVPGVGFWLAAYADAPFDIENAVSTVTSEPTVVLLQPGWNQIGNPFAFPVEWDAVVGSGLVQPPAFFDGAEYLLGQLVLDPWAGYFVLNETEMVVTLEVPAVEAFNVTRSSGQRMAGAEDYRLRLRAEVPERGLRDTQNMFGFAENAESGRLDLAEPPPIGPHLRLSAVEEGRRLAHSFRPADGDGGDWELEVMATPSLLASGPLRVRIALDELGVRPADYGLHVLDLDRTAPVVLEDGAFDIELRADRPVRRLRLIAGTDAYAESARQGVPLEPLTFALAPAYPNPFAGSATLAYQVAERTDVTLDVFDILGRRVAVLADGQHDAGRYTVRWDGRTAGGARAANGVYVYRLRAGSFTASHKVVLLR